MLLNPKREWKEKFDVHSFVNFSLSNLLKQTKKETMRNHRFLSPVKRGLFILHMWLLGRPYYSLFFAIAISLQ